MDEQVIVVSRDSLTRVKVSRRQPVRIGRQRIRIHTCKGELIMRRSFLKILLAALAAAGILLAGSGSALAASPRAGTTLQASKTIEVCALDASTWRYSGVV